MSNNLKHPPIIIIGMHRSGTGMITEMLRKLGLFVGEKKDANHEATFFCNINNWLFHQSGGAWDNPGTIRYLLRNEEVLGLTLDYIQFLINSPRAISFLGWRKYLRYHSIFNLDFPWGWKDPRNTFTLPIWLRLFPNAKVIHVYRHGVDVAKSIVVRQQKLLDNYKGVYGKRKTLYLLRPKRGGFTDTLRCANIENAFDLWEEYTSEAHSHILTLGDSAIEIKYEDFLDTPNEIVKTLVYFCGLHVNNADIYSVVETVKKGRAYAFRNDPALEKFAYQVTTRLKKMSY